MASLARSEERFSPKPPAYAWAETFVVTLAVPLLGIWIRAADPLFLRSAFPWLLLGPLVLGLRYGFAHGFGSALSLILGLAAVWRFHLLPLDHFPSELSVGLLMVGMLSGEFRDVWTRRITGLGVSNEYRRMRLDEFTRTYHLLKSSHDRLEKRLGVGPQGLRESLLGMRRQLLEAKPKEQTLEGLGPLILSIFNNYGWLQVSSIYSIFGNTEVDLPALAHVGEFPPIDPKDPLITEALESGQMVSVRVEADVDAPERQRQATRLLAVVPLVDVSSRIWAIVVVHEMPFVMFQDDHLKLLAVLGGSIADILAARTQELDAPNPAELDFLRQLQRNLEYVRHHDLPAVVVGLELSATRSPPNLAEWIVANCRGLDEVMTLQNRLGAAVILLLMPLTDLIGVDGYLHRVDGLIREQYGMARADTGLTVHTRQLVASDTWMGIMDYLRRTCRVDEQ